MTTLKEMAREYAGGQFPTEMKMEAYLAGAKAALEMAAKTVEAGVVCPFDGPNKLEPTDPCPVCGDLGTSESTDKPSRCQSTAPAIRNLIPE